MTEQYWDRLIHAHFDDGLAAAERKELENLLRDSEAARRRFWELAEIHGLAREAARIAWPEAGTEAGIAVDPVSNSYAANSDAVNSGGANSQDANSHDAESQVGAARVVRPSAAGFAPSSTAWLWPAALVAVGLMLGVLTTGLAWAISQPGHDSSRLLLSEDFGGEDFESAAAPLAGGVPTIADVWSGDFAELVEAQSGVQPASPGRMLRFLRADYAGKPNPGGYIGEVYRLIDVRGNRRELAEGDAVVQVSALFNAARFDDDQQYNCGIALFALDGATATDGVPRNHPALTERALATTRRSNALLDHDPNTWQNVSADLRLPADTEFLLLRIAVAHGPKSRQSAEHEIFTAHYADDVRISIARRPPLP